MPYCNTKAQVGAAKFFKTFTYEGWRILHNHTLPSKDGGIQGGKCGRSGCAMQNAQKKTKRSTRRVRKSCSAESAGGIVEEWW